MAIQESKIDGSISTSELFTEIFPYSVYRKDRNLNVGGVMLLIHKDISHMPITVHVLCDFNFRDIVWPDRLNKSGLALSPSEGQKLVEIINDHGLEQLVHLPTREKTPWI